MDTLAPNLKPNPVIQHGGDPKAHEAHFGEPKDGWLDLSTGINPTPYPLAPVPGEMMARLPLQSDLDALLNAARRAYGVPDGAAIVASPGTQTLIQMVPTLFAPSSVSIMAPTYGEHAPAWAAAGHRVEDVGSICAQAAQPAPYGVVVHPNNPDGRTQTVEGLLAFADELHDRGGVLVVDEAFADVIPELSVTPHAGGDGLIVLRSFGKFFGLAGVRLKLPAGWPRKWALGPCPGPHCGRGYRRWATQIGRRPRVQGCIQMRSVWMAFYRLRASKSWAAPTCTASAKANRRKPFLRRSVRPVFWRDRSPIGPIGCGSVCRAAKKVGRAWKRRLPLTARRLCARR